MTQIDLSYILRLLKGSKIFSDEQKEVIKTKIPELDEVKIAELKLLLEEEHRFFIDKYHREAAHHKQMAEKEIRAIYDYAEEIVEEKEEAEIENLDIMLANL